MHFLQHKIIDFLDKYWPSVNFYSILISRRWYGDSRNNKTRPCVWWRAELWERCVHVTQPGWRGCRANLSLFCSIAVSVRVAKCVHVMWYLSPVFVDLLSVPPGFKHGASFSDAKEEQGRIMANYDMGYEGGGGGGGRSDWTSYFPYLILPYSPLSLWFPFFAKYYATLQFFFLPVTVTLGMLLPTLSSPASRRLPAPLLQGSCPPVPPSLQRSAYSVSDWLMLGFKFPHASNNQMSSVYGLFWIPDISQAGEDLRAWRETVY